MFNHEMSRNLIHSFLVARCDSSEYGAVLESGSLYHSSAWRRVVENGFHIDVRYVVSTFGGRAVAVTPIYTKRRMGITIYGSPLRGVFTEFLGPLFVDGVLDKDKGNILVSQMAILREMKVPYIEFGTSSDYVAAGEVTAGIQTMGYVYCARPSLEVDLAKDKGLIWQQFESRARNMIRKSEKAGVTAQAELLVPELLAEYFGIIEATFANQGIPPPHPFRAYEAMRRNLQQIRALLFVVARYQGRMVSAGIFLIDGNRLVFHSGGSTPEGLEKAASSLVHWQAIQEAISRGVIRYDMGGVGLESIDKFKRSFGGSPIQHHRWVYVSPMLKRAKGLVEWVHRKGFMRVMG